MKDFLEKNLILIVDPSASFGQALTNAVIEMGAPAGNVTFLRKYEDALKFIEEKKPKILICEYYIGEKYGMALIDEQSNLIPESEKISILITHNKSSSAVAEAAEEQVDDYILKPFSMGQLKERLTTVITKKAHPSPYILKIREGKKYLAEKNFAAADLNFTEAKKLETQPTLAHYYAGFTRFVQKKFMDAIQEFRGGLTLEPLHYKCLLGEFDSFYEEKQFGKAYELIPTILNNFPISPKRFESIVVTAMFSSHHEDVYNYYKYFQLLDYRTPELIRIYSAALMTAGKFEIKNGNVSKALNCFERSINVVGPDVNYLATIIREFLKLQATTEASQFLAKFPSVEMGKSLHANLGFQISQYTLPKDQVIDRGKKIVSRGLADADSFMLLLKLILEEGKILQAEDIANKAVGKFPELRKTVYEMIEKKRVELETAKEQT